MTKKQLHLFDVLSERYLNVPFFQKIVDEKIAEEVVKLPAVISKHQVLKDRTDVDIICPHCGKTINMDKYYAARTFCANCGATVMTGDSKNHIEEKNNRVETSFGYRHFYTETTEIEGEEVIVLFKYALWGYFEYNNEYIIDKKFFHVIPVRITVLAPENFTSYFLNDEYCRNNNFIENGMNPESTVGEIIKPNLENVSITRSNFADYGVDGKLVTVPESFGLPYGNVSISTLYYFYKNKTKKTTKKKKDSSVMEEDITIPAIPGSLFNLSATFENDDVLAGQTTYKCHCHLCGQDWMQSVSRYSRDTTTLTCPGCGCVDTVRGSFLAKEVLRIWEEDDCLYMIYSEATTKEEKHQWILRVNYTLKTIEDFLWDKDGFKKPKRKSRAIPCVSTASKIFLYKETLNKFKYSGIDTLVNIAQEKDSYTENAFANARYYNYIEKWLRAPVYEQLLKAGFDKVVNIEMDVLDLDKKDIAGALKVKKSLVPLIKDVCNEGYNYRISGKIKQIQAFYRINHDVTKEEIEFFFDNRYDLNLVIKLIEEFGFSTGDIVQYLKRCNESQCIPIDVIGSLWYDYLYMAKNVGMDLSDHRVKYPNSLKLEHDRATAKFKLIKDQIQEKQFKERTELYGKKYSFENKEYFIKAPESMTELFNEGKKLSHCVGTYSNRIIAGTSCILFIRKKEEPDIPYFTCEVSDLGTLVQVRGYCNTTSKPKSLNDFLDEWKHEKNIA